MMSMDRNLYKCLEFENEDEDCAISSSARNYPTHGTRVTFDDDDGIIEHANYLTEVESTLQWESGYGFSLQSRQRTTPRHHTEVLLERVKWSFLPVCVSGRGLKDLSSH